VYLLVSQYGLTGALISQSLFYFILVIALFLTYGNLHVQFDKQLMKTLFNYSVVIGISSIGFYLYSRFSILILGYYGYIEEVNYFEIFIKITAMLAIMFNIIGQVIAPNITILSVKQKFERISSMYIYYLISSLIFSIFLCLGLYLSLPLIMELYFPHLLTEGFLQTIGILIWILPVNIISGGISQGFMVATGYARLGLLTIPFGILNVIMALIFINQFGYIGVAYSLIIVSFANKGITWFLLYRILSRKKYGK
jgi:O-antigen/teichoic acid export membrane protein